MSPTARAALFTLACSGVAGFARAHDTQGVRTTATVEVLDDASQVDDVISRMKTEPKAQTPKEAPAVKPEQAGTLRQERPALPKDPTDSDARAAGNRDGKHAVWRSREGAPDSSERADRVRRQK